MFKRSKTAVCPLLKGPCLEHGCEWYSHLIGANPQTGEQVDQWVCVVVALPMLMLENSQQQRQTGAAIESFRNEMVAGNDRAAALLAGRTAGLLEES